MRSEPGARPKLSAAVVCYNREAIVGTCLKALAFADEVIVVDKSSTDGTAAIAARLADRVISTPWTPTVEDTRAFAVAQCRHDWILLMDDDECLSPAAVLFIDQELRAPRADIYALPQRHYVMGVHDERAYYWPEAQVRLFRRDAVRFTDTVHAGTQYLSDRLHRVPPDGGVCMHHLSHARAHDWIEKTNRYTSRPNRAHDPDDGAGILAYAHARLDHWSAQSQAPGDDYVASVAALRAVYDIVDRIKAREQARGIEGAELFARACADLEAQYVTQLAGVARPHGPPLSRQFPLTAT